MRAQGRPEQAQCSSGVNRMLWVVLVSLSVVAGTLSAQEAKRQVVFDGDQAGANAKGWTHAPMGKVTIAAQDKEVRRKGKKTMEFHAAGHDYMGAGWNWMGFDPPDAGTDISAYKNLRFWAKVSGDKKPSQLSVAIKSNDKSATEADDMLQRCPSLLDGKWHELVIPINDLDSKNVLNKDKAWELQFNTWSQEDIDFSLFVDEIAFDGTADKASQGTAGPATTEDAQVAPRVVTKREVVYDGDQEGTGAKGWTAAPMGKVTIAAQDKVVRRKGKKTVEFHAAGHDYMGSGWNWMGFDPPDAGTDCSGYKNLSFWAKVTGAKKPSQLSVALKANDKTMTEADDLLQRCPTLLDGKWHELVIPINDLDSKNALSKAKAWEVQFNTWSQEEIDFSLFVDEIAFDGTAEAVSQAAEPVQVAAVPDKAVVGRLPANLSEQIMVDQFGFRPKSEKIVIFASPEKGQNSHTRYTPPAQATVRREKDGAAVLTVALKPWGGGKLDPTSGDKVWYADISRLQTPGNYYVWDASNRVRSYGFRIADDVYLPVLKAAIRAYFYQRCGGDVPEANGGTWHHPACHLAAGQDREAELYIDGRTRGQPRDVHGGWHDAGDYNKYVPFTLDVVQALLMAYEFNPSVFGDDWNIPESGNGIPDILDEVRWECDWLLRMQMPDGSVCNRVTERTSKSGVTPDKDSQHPRYYTQPTTWATATCAANLTYFARVIGKFPGQAAYARKCRAAAERAWTWLEQHPEMMPSDGRDHGRPSEAADGACDNGREGDVDRRVSAALQLWLLDPKPKYEAFFKKSRKDMLSLCFVQYALSPKADPALRGAVCAALQKNLNDLVTGPYKSHADAYLAYLPGYWWGCNQSKSEYGYRAMFAVRLGMNPAEDGICRAAAEDYLHFLHGRNPLCLVYLTNMGAKGAKAGVGKSIMRPFHTWFAEKSPWSGPDSLGPAPGLLVGGPNAVLGDGGAPAWLSPPAHEPPSKAFKDWATAWNAAHQGNENSWAFTEPAIYYQARYVLLLSQFVGSGR